MNTENQIVNEQDSESKFNFKMDELMEVAKKKKSILEYHEIDDFFKDMELDAEHFERILEKLESANIDVLRMTDDEEDDPIYRSDYNYDGNEEDIYFEDEDGEEPFEEDEDEE